MKMKNIYTKDLSVEEVIARLKRGEKVYTAGCSLDHFFSMVDGVIVLKNGDFVFLNAALRSSDTIYFFKEEIFIDFKIGNYYKTTTGKKALCYHIDENAKENEAMFFFAPIGTENRSVIMLNEEGEPIGNEVGIECEWVEEDMVGASSEYVEQLKSRCEKSPQRNKLIPISKLRNLLADYKKSGLTWRVLYKKCDISSGNFYNLLNSNRCKYVRLSTYNRIKKAIEELTNDKNCD